MHHYFWRYIIAIVSLVLLSFFLYGRIQDGEYKLLMEEKKRNMWQQHLEQIQYENKNHLRTFKKMQKNSPLLQYANYKFLAGTIPQEKKLLTVGISSVHHPHGNDLLDTLQSLFHVSSEPELKYITVLVHLSDPDPGWLSQKVANISSLFKQHIETQKLLVIHGFLNSSFLPGDLNTTNHSSSCEALYFRQKADYALLMNVASNLSDYFLMIGDVHFVPKFVSAIYWALSSWKEMRWVILEFSSLSFSGKVFHTSDLSRLTSFFFLFPKDTPTDLLLSNFGSLLGQTAPIRLIPNLFYSQDNSSPSEDTCNPEEGGKEEDLGKPTNPPGKIYTNMAVGKSHLPKNTHFLNDVYFLTEYAIPGNMLIFIFNQSLKVTRVQVLTGIGKQGLYRLKQGQVELGYEPVREKRGCAVYLLLGPLVKGKLDQKVFYKEDSVGAVKCIQLLVTAPQESKVYIRMIKIWIESEEGQE